MKILITGVSGFIGQYLSKSLVDKNYEVWGAYESESSFEKNPDINEGNKVLYNLKDKDSIDAMIKLVLPDIVIHLAAKTEVALSFDNYSEVSQVNYVGTVNLAEANRIHNPDLKLFIMASTMETYGHHEESEGAFTELTEQKPMAPYAVAKLACEKYLEYMKYAYNFPYTILRQTNAYGRTDNDFFVVERIISQMLKGESCNLGEPTPIRNFLFIFDLVDLYGVLIDNIDKAKWETFVTGPDNGVSIEELVNICKALIGFEGPINWDTIPKRPGEIFYLNSDPSKAKVLLEWEPKVSLEEGLNKTIEIWKKNLQ